MPYLPQVYRPTFYNALTDEKNYSNEYAQEIVKAERTLEVIRNSSSFLKSLELTDTKNLIDVLVENNLNPPVYFSDGNIKGNLENQETNNPESESHPETEDIANPLQKPEYNIPLEALSQLNTLLILNIRGVPHYITEFAGLIENLLSFIMDRITEKIPTVTTIEDGEVVTISKEYNWSYMGLKRSSIKNQDIFVHFEDAMMQYMFLTTLQNLTLPDQEKISLICDSKYTADIQTQIANKFKVDISLLDEVKTEIAEHIESLTTMGETTLAKNKPDDDYLTKFQKLADNYSINSNDLDKVPANMLDDVKKYVLNFRLHVLTSLEKKQKERALKDQLGARKANESAINSDRLRPAAAEIIDPSKHISDIQYETMMQKKDKVALDKKYFLRLTQYKKQEELRIKAHNNFITYNKYESYVNNILPQNRKKFMANFVDGITDGNNKIDKNFTYYTKHANYLKFRAKAKALEESLDLKDSLDEKNATNQFE